MSTLINEVPAEIDAGLPQQLIHFVEHEARLLDARDFRAWHALFGDDGCYWVPASQTHTDPARYVSLFYDEPVALATRVQRLLHPEIHSQIPPSSTVRVIGNFWIERSDEFDASFRVQSKFIMLEDRQATARHVYGGTYTHFLRRDGQAWRIRMKRVDLTNCDHALTTLTQPF
jgi:3-phenylpropionate/cinnamic acid dioxygenase small subunit